MKWNFVSWRWAFKTRANGDCWNEIHLGFYVPFARRSLNELRKESAEVLPLHVFNSETARLITSPSWEAKSQKSLTQARNYPPLIGPDSSLPRSQNLPTGPWANWILRQYIRGQLKEIHSTSSRNFTLPRLLNKTRPIIYVKPETKHSSLAFGGIPV